MQIERKGHERSVGHVVLTYAPQLLAIALVLLALLTAHGK